MAGTEVIIAQLFDGLRQAGLVERVTEPKGPEDVPGYQLKAASLHWSAGNGTVAPDPVRMPRPPEGGLRPNAFFRSFYESVAADGAGLFSAEHTAQVPYEVREQREEAFRTAALPVLFCSPTMELGVDIAELNVVGLRNVPPTPANYAQRSARAGRSGQPALVVTCCSAGSAHDQWFFRHPEDMVAGVVNPPRLDLANEDLVRAHVQALWLSAASLNLGASLTDILAMAGEHPSLALGDHVRDAIALPAPRQRAADNARIVLADLAASGELDSGGWWSPGWLDDALASVARRFEDATARWRDLYRSAQAQVDAQNRVIGDASRPARDREAAKRLLREAWAELDLLRADTGRRMQSDFYSYRYFATEGFVPGYSFPRLPLAAFVPGRRHAKGDEESLSRPRFLAISEFGPQNFIYHEGSRYQVNRVTLPVGSARDDADQPVFTRAVKICVACGYLHPMHDEAGFDLCQSCGEALGVAIPNLFRLQNVVTRRRERINSDEEERQRQGYELRSAIRFGPNGPVMGTAVLGPAAGPGAGEGPAALIASLAYGHSATIWRINHGWRRRRSESPDGFLLDLESGRWQARPDAPESEVEDPMGPRQARVIPYVEDSRNCLVIEPMGLPSDAGAEPH